MAPPRVAASGITTNATTGERHIPSSVRADGSTRREIRIRPGYKPPEDVELYKNRSAAAWRSRGKGGVPGAEGLGRQSVPGAEGVGGGSNKNAKRREARRKGKEGEDGNEGGNVKGILVGKDKEDWRSGAPVRAGSAKEEVKEEPVDPEVEEKKARALKKKLRQARDLREKKDQGGNLLPEQFEKVIRINELIRQLDALGFDAEGEKKQAKKETAEEKDTAV